MPQRKTKLLAAGLTCVVLLIFAGCSSNSSTATTTTAAATGSTASGGSGKMFTIGILTDASGPGASESATSVLGAKAAVGVAATMGYKIKYVVADTATSTTGALSGAQQLVEQDHVFGVIAASALFFSAAPYLTSNGIPVVGGAYDSSEWLSPKNYNMFSVIGNQDFTKVYTTTGVFLKSQGVTNLGSIGYSVSPSSAAAARASAVSAKAQGIKVGYLNDSFPFGSTNVGPAALAMKSAGVDALVADTEPSTVFALATALQQEGVHLKATVLPTGGGGDLIASGPAAIQAAQGDDFLSDSSHPRCIRRPQRRSRMRWQSTPTSTPIRPSPSTSATCRSSVWSRGYKGAGANPTQSSVIKSLSRITDYNAEGLWGGHQTVDWSKRPQGLKECFWMTKLSGSTFHLIAGNDPVCGTQIPGKSV